MKRVLIIDGAKSREFYSPTRGWRRYLGSISSDSVHLPFGEEVSDLDRYSHLIVTGSESSIVELEPWYEVEANVIRQAFSRGMAVLGSCFGHQMLVNAISGSQYVRRSPTPEIGWISVDQTGEDPIFDGVPQAFACFACHFDEVISPPEPWLILAKSRDCAAHVVRYGDHPVWGIQAHPEITVEEAQVLLAGCVAKEPDRAAHFRSALDTTPVDDCVAETVVANFLKQGKFV